MVVGWGPHDVCGWCVPSVCRELELTVWVMWRPCKVGVRCHPDARGLNEAVHSEHPSKTDTHTVR